MLPDTPDLVRIKYRGSAAQMGRMFSSVVHDLERRQSKPLPMRPEEPPPSPGSGLPPDDPLVSGDPGPAVRAAGDSKPGDLSGTRPRPKRARAKPLAGNGTIEGTAGTAPKAAARPSSRQGNQRQKPPLNLDDEPEWPEDIETRPDGSPGGLTAYAPKAPVVEFIPREAPIMVALATRGEPWRIVNAPADQARTDPVQDQVSPVNTGTATDMHPSMRGLLDLRERVFTGDALARFTSARFDPDVPIEPLRFDDDEAVVELELISTGGDLEAEARRAAMIAAHPEGKPIVTFRYGAPRPPVEPPDAPGEAPGDAAPEKPPPDG